MLKLRFDWYIRHFADEWTKKNKTRRVNAKCRALFHQVRVNRIFVNHLQRYRSSGQEVAGNTFRRVSYHVRELNVPAMTMVEMKITKNDARLILHKKLNGATT